MSKREPYSPLLCSYPDSEKINSVSLGAECLFCRLIARCDDAGNYEGDPVLLMCGLFAKRFQKGAVTVTDVERFRDELVTAGLIDLYKINGATYTHIRNVKKVLRSDIKRDIRFPQAVDLQGDVENVTEPEQKRNASDANSSRYYKTTTYTNTANETNTYRNSFEDFRKLYLGTKRGLEVEFANFCKKHKDWREVLPKLLPAIKSQIENKKIRTELKLFVSEWKNLQTWINQRCWEEELPEIPGQPKHRTFDPIKTPRMLWLKENKPEEYQKEMEKIKNATASTV